MGYKARFHRHPAGGYRAVYGKTPYRVEAIFGHADDDQWTVKQGFGEGVLGDRKKLRDLKADWAQAAEKKYCADVAAIPEDNEQRVLFPNPPVPPLPSRRDIKNCEVCNRPIYRWGADGKMVPMNGCTCGPLTPNGDLVNALTLEPKTNPGPPSLPRTRPPVPGTCTICGHSAGNPNPCKCSDCGCLPF